MINGDLGSFKRVAPLCLNSCSSAPFLNITQVCLVYLARIIHEGSLRKRADAKRDGHSEV